MRYDCMINNDSLDYNEKINKYKSANFVQISFELCFLLFL